MKIEPVIDHIRDFVLKFVPARCIYLFGFHAYGAPTKESDIDIYVVTPDDTKEFSMLYAKIRGDLSKKKIFFIDLSLATESTFNTRRTNRMFESTIYQKGRILYER